MVAAFSQVGTLRVRKIHNPLKAHRLPTPAWLPGFTIHLRRKGFHLSQLCWTSGKVSLPCGDILGGPQELGCRLL